MIKVWRLRAREVGALDGDKRAGLTSAWRSQYGKPLTTKWWSRSGMRHDRSVHLKQFGWSGESRVSARKKKGTREGAHIVLRHRCPRPRD